jgi:hypothetical protein
MEILFGLVIAAVICFAGLYVVRGFRSGLRAGLRAATGESCASDLKNAEDSQENPN